MIADRSGAAADARGGLRALEMLAFAAWFGLATGLVDGTARVLHARFDDRAVGYDPDIIWMAPVAYLLLFAVLCTPLVLASRRWPRAASGRVFLPFMVALSASSLALLAWGRIHTPALVLFAVGASVAGTRVLLARRGLLWRIAPRTLPLLGGLTLLLAGATWGREIVSERMALARLPDARAGAPNVLLIILDTVRALNLSVYGYERPTTPTLERVAAEGVVFERAMATAPWTLPSHASMFTGRYPHELDAGWTQPLGDRHPTLAELLAARGYRTGAFVANMVFTPSTTGLAQGFARYEDHPKTLANIMASATPVLIASKYVNMWRGTFYRPTHKPAETITEDFTDWAGSDPGRPFFAFLNYYDAHNPYAPPPPFDLKFARTEPVIRNVHVGKPYTDAEIQGLRDAYDGAIAYMDHEIGKLLAGLDSLGVLDNTLVIITSDHGEGLGEHGYVGHGTSLYAQELHVPLLLRFPRALPGGVRVPEPVSLRDLPATIMDLLGYGSGSPFPGSPLTAGLGVTAARHGAPRYSPVISLLEPNYEQLPDNYPVTRGRLQSIIIAPYHYIRYADGGEELYDVERDPLERRDLARSPTAHSLLPRMDASLSRALAHGGLHALLAAPRAVGGH